MSRDLARRAGSAVVWRSGTLAAEKLIFLARLVILARILVPEDFGLVAIGMAAMALATSMTDLGVVAALVQDPATDRRHLDTAWTISVIRGLLVTAVLWLGAPWIAEAFGEPQARPFVQAIGVTVLLRAAASIRIAHLNRELHFRSLSLIGLATALTNTVVAVALAPSQGAWSLVWGAIAGALTFLATSFLAAPYVPRLRLLVGAAGSIMRFGRWIFLLGILAVLSDTLLRLVIARKLGVAELGLFFMAARLGFLPAQLITEIVGTVAFPVYAQLQSHRDKATNMYRKVLIATMALMGPLCAVMVCLVPSIVSDLLGERWQGTVVIMQTLIISTVVGILGDSVAPLLKGIGRPAKIAWMESLQLIILILLAWFMVGPLGLAGAGLAWLGSVIAVQVLAYGYAARLLDRPFDGIGRVLLAIAVATGVAGLTAGVLIKVFAGIPGIVLAAGLSLLTAAVVAFALDRQFQLGFRATLSEAFPWMHRGARI